MSLVLANIRALLTDRGVAFREVHHEPTSTSEDSARARGEPLRIGGKALLIKVDKDYALFVLPADRKIDSASVRKELGLRKLRFATPDELAELSQPVNGEPLVPGSIPPFGPPILPFTLYVDNAIQDNDRIAFNAGSLTDSMILDVHEYLAIANPHSVFSFSKS